MAEDELYARYLASQSDCQKLAHEFYSDPAVQVRYPNGVEFMFTLDAFMQVAPIDSG